MDEKKGTTILERACSTPVSVKQMVCRRLLCAVLAINPRQARGLLLGGKSFIPWHVLQRRRPECAYFRISTDSPQSLCPPYPCSEETGLFEKESASLSVFYKKLGLPQLRDVTAVKTTPCVDAALDGHRDRSCTTSTSSPDITNSSGIYGSSLPISTSLTSRTLKGAPASKDKDRASKP